MAPQLVRTLSDIEIRVNAALRGRHRTKPAMIKSAIRVTTPNARPQQNLAVVKGPKRGASVPVALAPTPKPKAKAKATVVRVAQVKTSAPKKVKRATAPPIPALGVGLAIANTQQGWLLLPVTMQGNL